MTLKPAGVVPWFASSRPHGSFHAVFSLQAGSIGTSDTISAAHLTEEGRRLKYETRKQGTDEEELGYLFCFLPLPADGNSYTGLPVHVNGFFALEQNRKYVKWPALNTREDLMDKRLLWNQCMLKEALPKAYTQMLLDAIRLHSTGKIGEAGLAHKDPCGGEISVSDIYRAFPDFSRVDKKWECVLPIIFAELFKYPTVYTSTPLTRSIGKNPSGLQLEEQGGWILPRDAVFNTLDPATEEAYDVIRDVLAASRTVKVSSSSQCAACSTKFTCIEWIS